MWLMVQVDSYVRQGVGWPAFSQVIYQSYPPQQRGTAWSAASTVTDSLCTLHSSLVLLCTHLI